MELDRFTDAARAAVQNAKTCAVELGHRRVMPLHLLMGLVAEPSDPIAQLLERLGVRRELLEKRAYDALVRLPRGDGASPGWDPDLALVVDSAKRESRRRGDDSVRSDHLLVALADGPVGTARQLLQEAGVTRTGVQYMVREMGEAIEREVSAPRAHRGRTTSRAGSQAGDRGGVGGSSPRSDASGEPSLPALSLADTEVLQQFGRDLVALSQQGALDPVIGREREIRRLMQVLGRRTKNNPVLVGEAGVGKTAIVEGLAHRIASGDVPSHLRDRLLVQIDLGALVAGTTLRGQFEERIRKIVQEIAQSQGRILLFFDELHAIATSGSGSSSAANLLKPALARGELTIIGTTTPAEYRKHIESDKALERRFQEVQIDEPSDDEAVSILRGLKQKYEIHHRVRIEDAALISAVRLSKRYVPDRHLPDKALDLIDEAASRLRMQIESMPTAVDELKHRILQLEMEREALRSDPSGAGSREEQRLAQQVDELRERFAELRDQFEEEKHALEKMSLLKSELEATEKLVVKAEQENDLGRAAELKYAVIQRIEKEIEEQQRALDELLEDRPMLREDVAEEDIANVVAEWTGIPVTKMLESERKKLLAIEERLSERVVGQAPAIQAIAAAVRRSRAGLQSGSRPIGNFFFVGPTGVGKTELAKALAEFLFDSEEAMIRIDMSEYMEQSKVNTLIGSAFGYVDSDKGGILTEAVRRRPYSVVLFDEAEKAHPDVFNILLQVLDEGRLTDSSGRRIDFSNTIIIMTSNVGSREILDLCGTVSYEELDERVHKILRDHFKPEFLNRLDDTVVFNALDRDVLREILDILLRSFSTLLARQELTIEFTHAARELLIDEGYEPEYGARPLKRALLMHVQDPLALQILRGDFEPGDDILADVSASGDKLTFRPATPES